MNDPSKLTFAVGLRNRQHQSASAYASERNNYYNIITYTTFYYYIICINLFVIIKTKNLSCIQSLHVKFIS